ncbi:MAG: T9SS type A sorting domain-containing protein [Ignavibacteriales bacterium]|nr:T9SS type A sorting domain-containing protein [Ignavibacteriales bacterium]
MPFNSIGQKVQNISNDTNLSGYNELNISLTGLPSGVYFVRVEQSGYSDTIKILLNK